MFTLDTLFLGRMGNAQSRTHGMNYPLQVYISFSGRAQELGWSSVSCRKQLQQWADFFALCLFSFLHYSPAVYFWCEKCSSLVGMSSFSSLFFQISSMLLNEPGLMCDRANQLLMVFFTSGRPLISFRHSSLPFIFVSTFFTFLLPLLSNISQTHLVRHLHVLKFTYSCLWHLLVKETLPFPLLTLLEIKLTETKLGLMYRLLRKKPNQKAGRRWEPRNQGNLPFTWER